MINEYDKACESVNSGLISQGLQTSVVFIVAENRDVISGFSSNNNKYYWINNQKFMSSGTK